MKKRWLLPIFASFMIFSGIGTDNAEAASVADLTNTAMNYIGAPYQYGGTSIKYGIDCSAYTQLVFSKLGISLPRSSSAQYNEGTYVSKSNLQAGDLVFFNTSGRGVSHVGIYIGNNKFISATTSGGVAVDSINDPYYWGSRYVGAKRVANFNEEKAEVKAAAVDFTRYASRGQVALQLAEALQLDTSDTNSPFNDIAPDSKYAGAVTALNKIGAFNGNEAGNFEPNSPITRGQLSYVLTGAFNLDLQGEAEQFSDVPEGHWAYEGVKLLSSTKLTYGRPDGTFGVNDYVTHTHITDFINRFIYKYNK
ncbi:peptidase [Ureibacillus massiliensis 4400831 = CIP 108448 = CCUG 49529]|uniref:Peptidase n=2 Tax=cellular organisms TaxID=131567 RepID=A0A0A3J3P1_9BACL|nr:C40 family peptidase [Ureibacillus massiliensis]KGR90290.1 peptidase [Ureibacillus massiliensis 4400831 = CIP 108448 = CCUG 49529]